MIERSLILIKPDGVKRGIIGEVISRLEKTGLKIIGMKMVLADNKIADEHYRVTEQWAKAVYDRTKKVYEKTERDFPFQDHMEYGEIIQGMCKDFLKEGHVVALVFEGPHAVEIIRKIVGHTEPRQALPGTIRGDFLYDSYTLADSDKRAIRNLIHASGDVKEAEREIGLWFKKDELLEKKD